MIIIEWMDAESDQNWIPTKDIEPPSIPIITKGEYIKENDDYITVGLSYDESNDSWSNFVHILKRCIVNKREINETIG